MPEHDAAERARHEADREGRVGEERRDDRVVDGEEELVEHDPGDDAVEEEVVPLDRRPDDARGDDAPHAVLRYSCLGHDVLPVNRCCVSSRIRSAAFSAIMMIGTLVFPETRVGMTEPSTTHKPSTPRTRSRGSTTASSSEPMRQVPEGWKIVAPCRRAKARRSSSLCAAGPGCTSSAT